MYNSGRLTNVTKITRMFRRYNAFVFFDYAAAAPYLKIDMNPIPVYFKYFEF